MVWRVVRGEWRVKLMAARFLILETSHASGWTALAEGSRIVARRRLEEARRHARDLVPATAELLAELGWRARDLNGVIVSVGPGSYTGLRVGLMSAKTLAYASGAALLGVETFRAIAVQAPTVEVAVVADAQQGKIYAQTFDLRAESPVTAVPGLSAAAPLSIQLAADWVKSCPPTAFITGPGVELVRGLLPAEQPFASGELRLSSPESLLALGLARFQAGERDDPFTLEPLYLRASSAEELWVARGNK